MQSVVLKLERLCKEKQFRPTVKLPLGPGLAGKEIVVMEQSFIRRLVDVESRKKVEELQRQIRLLLGPEAVDWTSGVYKAPRLYRFLLGKEMNVQEASSAIFVDCAGRSELHMTEKRQDIGKLPRMFVHSPFR